MKQGVVSSKKLFRRLDVKYHFNENKEIDNYDKLCDLKELIVRDPNCYGFRYSSVGIPMIRISDIGNPFINYDNVAYVNERIHNKYKKTQLQKFDILMSVRGVSIGKIGIFMGEYSEANISANLIIIRLKNPSYAPYVAMSLISSVGQSQISRSIGGGSKPTITSGFIDEIEIPTPPEEVLKNINQLFFEAFNQRGLAKESTEIIDSVFDELFKYEDNKKSVSYTKNILDNNRWDSHYHNPKYINTRRKVDAENAKYLKNLVTEVTESVDKLHEDKVGYIEISNVNNRTGRINGIKFDYINKLPKNGKIILKDEDILISKVRPYRGSIAIYKEYSAELCTASKSAFVVIRAEEFMYSYYLTAFLRYRLGLDQIVMNQSGTTYPTVKPEEIMNVKVILLEDMKMKEINEIYRKNIDSKYHEEKNIQSIIELLESSFS